MKQKNTTSDIPDTVGESKKRTGLIKILRLFFIFAPIILISGSLLLAGSYFYLKKNLPKITSLKDYRPPIITTVYADDNRKIAEFYTERRVVAPLSKMPKMLLEAFVSAEDSRFFTHKGIDFLSILRAAFKNIEAGGIVQGGSTITQQVTKSFFLTPERSFIRKIKEAILAYHIDKTFSKEDILYLYLNQIYLGHGAYGVQAAAENYFGKSVEDLNLAECALLAGLPQAPSRFSPFRHPERAKNRQIYTLNRMTEEGYITSLQAAEAIDTELDIKPRKNWYIEKVPCYTEHVRRYVEGKYGKKLLYSQGLKIYTTVNIDLQKAARTAVQGGLEELDKRIGYRGPIRHIPPEEIEPFSKSIQEEHETDPVEEGETVTGVVIGVDDSADFATVRIGNIIGKIEIADMDWARKPDPEVPYSNSVKIKHPGKALKTGDVILVKIKGKILKEEEPSPAKKKDLKKTSDDAGPVEEIWSLALAQTPVVQAALLCMEAGTGKVKVMIGGRDFLDSQFNRAFQSRRQPGSAFKPIIYAAALDKGYTPATIIIDSPVIDYDEVHDFTWKPKNYGQEFYGPTLLRDALAKSRNVVTIKILKAIGIDYAIDYAKKLGINSPLSRDLSIALGSSGVSLLEIVNAYSVFANQGYRIDPLFVIKIVDRDGIVLEENTPIMEQVIEKSTAYIMTSLLESVVKEGTGHRVKALNRPVAGKTGTSNDLLDTWFVGYTPQYITGVWVGFDNEETLGQGETGSRTASPIWLEFMQKAEAGKPVRDFQAPEKVVFTKIDAETGLLPIPESKKTRFECFKEGTEPTEFTKPKNQLTEPEDFYKSGM